MQRGHCAARGFGCAGTGSAASRGYNGEDSSPSLRDSHARVRRSDPIDCRRSRWSGHAPWNGRKAMWAQESIFFDFRLPNVTTWFYFSLLLAVALFFKFSRLLSMRNLDLASLFLPVPGLLLLLESQGRNRWAYVWLMAASGFLLVRCLLDLALVRRPALSPNLNLGGLSWLTGAMFVS